MLYGRTKKRYWTENDAPPIVTLAGVGRACEAYNYTAADPPPRGWLLQSLSGSQADGRAGVEYEAAILASAE